MIMESDVLFCRYVTNFINIKFNRTHYYRWVHKKDDYEKDVITYVLVSNHDTGTTNKVVPKGSGKLWTRKSPPN